MNSYPFLNNKHKPIFTSDLADIVPRVRRERTIDITSSPVVPASSLRAKLEVLHRAGELDGGLPILRDGVLVGLIPAPDLEYALDGLRDEGGSKCLMAPVGTVEDSDDPEYGGGRDPCDFTAFVDPVSFSPFFRFLSPSFWEGPFSLFRRRGVGVRLLSGNAGAGRTGHQVAHGPGVRVLCQARAAVYLCLAGRQVCRHGESIFPPLKWNVFGLVWFC